MANDATGNPIVIGNYYGFFSTSSGISYVSYGKAEKIKNSKVTLKVIKKICGVFQGSENPDPPHLVEIPTKSVNVMSMSLFPIDINSVKY